MSSSCICAPLTVPAAASMAAAAAVLVVELAIFPTAGALSIAACTANKVVSGSRLRSVASRLKVAQSSEK